LIAILRKCAEKNSATQFLVIKILVTKILISCYVYILVYCHANILIKIGIA